jgi:XTP/dITP diphosphohydrolase/tetrapyrrole methylase family protein/MazG family protein
LVRRHPHVFGDEKGTIDQADQVVDRWEQVKAEEKKQKGESDDNSSIFKKLPPRLPALLFAYDIYKRAEKANIHNQMNLAEKKIDLLSQDLDEEKAGRVLFEIVAACRRSGLDPEASLRSFASKQMKELEEAQA